MSQRRMPSGQGPARGAGRPSSSAGARPAGARTARRATERTARPEPGRTTGRTEPGRTTPAARTPAEPASRTHQAGPGQAGARTGLRRTAGPARRTKAPRLPRRVSGRAAALGLLLLALTLAYAYPLRVYLAQQAQIAQLEQAQAEQRKRIQDLADRVARWNDDEYVTAQARSRLQLVRAGERVYVVGVEPTATTQPAEDVKPPWFQQVWTSVQTADDPPTP